MKKGKKGEFSIGVFDSGFGGLDIMRGIVKALPGYSYIYLGDNARNPYGSRSPELIYSFTRQAVQFLFEHNCWLVVLACNTASSRALAAIQQKYLVEYYPARRVLGVIIPSAEEAAFKSRNKRIGVVATEATIASKTFEEEIDKINPGIKVFQKACPLLVPFVESGEYNSPACQSVIKSYLQPITEYNIDTLVLGCTHYGILESKIKKNLSQNIQIISQKRIVGQKLKDYLIRHPEIESRLKKEAKIKFYTTDLTNKFIVLGSKFFGRPIKAKKIELQ